MGTHVVVTVIEVLSPKNKNPKGNCETPVPLDNVVNNIYTPLSPPLFIYASKKSLNTEAAVKEFVNFYLDDSWKWVDQVGYVHW